MTAINRPGARDARPSEVLECECCATVLVCNYDRTIYLWLCAECLEDEVDEFRMVPVAGHIRRYETRKTHLPPAR